MTKYMVKFDGELMDEVFDTERQADSYGLYLQGCERDGAEILHMSNPGDYEYDEDSFEFSDYEVVKVEVDG